MTTSIASKNDHQDRIDILTAVLADLTALKTALNQLITDYDAHVHGGVTAGAASSAAPTATTAAAVTLTTAA